MSDGRARGARLVQRIFEAYEAEGEDRRPNRLRPSELGAECSRWLWLRYRWADKFEKFEGRMKRLFETGFQQEDRLAEDLRKVGAKMYVRDPDNPKEQISTTLFSGHVKGFLDGVAEGLPEANHPFVLTEMKTTSLKAFKQIQKDGVAVAKPQHYAQQQLYMHQHKLPESLYICVCKDTDDLYCEFVEYDQKYAEALVRKAQMAIFSSTPPSRISENPTYYKCKFCSAAETCHLQSLPVRSCRTCRFGQPVLKDGATLPTWFCAFHNAELDLDLQKEGCQQHRFNPHMVRGEESGEEGESFVYRDGDMEFIDAGPEEA